MRFVTDRGETMEYGVNLSYFRGKTELKNAVKWIYDAGFRYLDHSVPFYLDNWKEIVKEETKMIEDAGLTVHQTHFPMNRYGRWGKNHKLYGERCMEAASMMGVKYVAIHGDEFDFENLTYSPDAALSYNYDYFLPFVKDAEKRNVKLAFETVFADWDRPRFSADPEELLKLIHCFCSDNVVCCWDFGHANVHFPDTAADWILKFGSLIECTHVHDNCGIDAHQIPFTGDIDWKKTMDAFKKIGYSGVFSIEFSRGNVAEALLPDYLKLTYKLTEKLWNL